MKWAELPGKSQVLGSRVSEGGDENMRMEYTVSHIPIALGQLFTYLPPMLCLPRSLC